MSFSESFYISLSRSAPKFSVLMTVMALIISTNALFDLQAEKEKIINVAPPVITNSIKIPSDKEKKDRVDLLLAKMDVMENKFQSYSTELAAIKTNTIDKATAVAQLAPVSSDLQSMKKELKELKKLIVNNPETSLSLSKIQQQIEFLQSSNERIYKDISIYTNIGMWLIGALITISLARLSLFSQAKFFLKIVICYNINQLWSFGGFAEKHNSLIIK